MSKYIKAIILMHEQPLSDLNSGSCVFNDIEVSHHQLGNKRCCGDIECDDCIFCKDNLINDIEAISHEQIN